jgi:hypothetical protein
MSKRFTVDPLGKEEGLPVEMGKLQKRYGLHEALVEAQPEAEALAGRATYFFEFLEEGLTHLSLEHPCCRVLA